MRVPRRERSTRLKQNSGCRGVVVCGLLYGLGFWAVPCWADWPQFLGPNRNSVASEAKGLPRSWPAGGPKILWKVRVGMRFGGPAIYGGSVLLLDREGNARDVLRRIRLADGKEIWRYAYDAAGNFKIPGSRGTPATDGELIFTVGPLGHLKAVKFADGSPVWQAHLLEDWQAKLPNWGVSTSPLLRSNTIVVTPWGRKAAIVAYDKASGKVVWQTPNSHRARLEYTSPVPMTLDGQDMIVASAKARRAKVHTIGVDADTGTELWCHSDYKLNIPIASPAVLGDGRILLTGGYNAGSAMFKVQHKDGAFSTQSLWRSDQWASKIGQPIVFEGHIYANGGLCFKARKNGLCCITMDGKVKWDTGGSPWFDMGNVLLADGLLFVLNGRGGDLVMVEPSPDGYKELGRARILKGSQIWAPIAYKDGKLVIRDQRTLVCVDLVTK